MIPENLNRKKLSCKDTFIMLPHRKSKKTIKFTEEEVKNEFQLFYNKNNKMI